MAFYNPGDVIISRIVLAGKKGSISLIDLQQSLSIYEDITLPGINAELILHDDKNLQAYLPITGEEVLYVEYNTPSLQSFAHLFNVASAENITPSTNLKSRVYKLVCVSPDVMTNKSTQIQKSYNTNLDKIITDIFQSFLKTDLNVAVEQTRGIQNYIIQNKRPYEAALDITKRAASIENPTSSYLLFENAKGINFKTLEGLFKEDVVAEFTNSEIVNDSIFRVNFRNIISYNIPNMYNTPNKIGQGAFASTVKTFDFKTLKFGSQDIVSQLVGSSSEIFKKTFSGHSGITSFIPNDFAMAPTHINDFMAKQRAFASEASQSIVHVKIFGDSTLTAGNMVYLHILDPRSDTGARSDDPIVSGKYIISKMNSAISPADVKPQFVQFLELTPKIS